MKWSDVVYLSLIAALAFALGVKSCGSRSNADVPDVILPANCDSLLALVDSLKALPADTIYITEYKWKSYTKVIERIDTLQVDPPIHTYITVNDTPQHVFIVDTITVAGDLLSHTQLVQSYENTMVITEEVPVIVHVRDTLVQTKVIEKPTSPKFAASIGAQAGYVFDKAFIAPEVELQFNRWQFSITKPLNNAESFILSSRYQLFKK